VLEELVFQRVKTPQSYPKNTSNGTWKLLTSSYTSTDGQSQSATAGSITAYQLITPTHWMYASTRDKKFEHVMGGTYILKGDKYNLNLDFASFAKSKWGKTEMTVKLQGDKLQTTGISQFPDGKKFTWDDTFERAR
jgi:hypothetical protein